MNQTAPIVEIRNLTYAVSGRSIFSGLDLDIVPGRVTAIMGPSGTGKTTLLRLITGQLAADSGSIMVAGQDMRTLRRRCDLYVLRRRMGMLFQNGALLTDLSVFENVAFPLREHTDLPERLIRQLVLMKLQAVGLRGAADLMPAELSGGMTRRVALARAIVMDPEILIYDEPFVGLDPISMGVILRLIRRLNDALGLTSIVVSHDVHEISGGGRYGIPVVQRQGRGAWYAKGDARLPLGYREAVRRRIGRRTGSISLSGSRLFRRAVVSRRGPLRLIRELWSSLIDSMVGLGAITRFLMRLIGHSPRALLRFDLIMEQIFNSGALSLVIIMLSGLFVGMVLGLQGFQLLERFGSAEALGTAAAIGLVKELGPVVTALLFAGRAGTALASEFGLMRATDQLSAMEMMAVDPIQRVVVPRFLGGIISMPLLAAIFSVIGIYGAQLVGVQIMGVDSGSFWSQMRAGVDLRDVNEGIVKSCIFGIACSLIAVYEGYYAIPTAEGVGRATTRTVVTSAVVVLFLDYLLTAAFY